MKVQALYTKLAPKTSAIALLGIAMAAPAPGQELPPPSVQVAPATERVVQPLITLPGTIISRQDAVLTAELDGKLEQIVDTGEYREAGEALASIDQQALRIAVRTARSRIDEIAPQLEFYTNEERRLAKLSAQDNASRSLREQAAAQRDELSGRLQSARLELERAEDTLRRSQVLAPTDGVVVERYKRVGEFVKNGETLIRFVDVSQLEAQVRVPESSAAGLVPGAEVKLISGQSQKQGEVRVLVPVADQSQLYEARISYQGDDWPAGLAVRALVPSAKPRRGVVIPRAALVIRSYGTNVFRVNAESMVEQVPVKVLYGEGDEVEVRAELKDGDKLVIRGAERLRPGQQVRIDSGAGEAAAGQ